MRYIRDPHEDPTYTGQHWFVGRDHHEGMVVYVGKPKRQMMMSDDGGLYFRKLVHLGFRCRDGVLRRGRFCQSDKDTFTPGDIAGRRIEISDPSAWPAHPTPAPGAEGETR